MEQFIEFNYEKEKIEKIDQLYKKEMIDFKKLIVVLDDDPTGTQTVHDVDVYTDWSLNSLRKAFQNSERMFYILTNSRSFSAKKSTDVHKQIAKTLFEISIETKRPFVIVSRADSTLRGHYPLETEVLKNTLEQNGLEKIDGEIICPAFFEAERYTIEDIHYVKQDDRLLPVSESEFSKDQTFGYHHSDLKEYIFEKSGGKIPLESCISISLNDVRDFNIDKLTNQLMTCHSFNKVIVNATNYVDLKIFTIALLKVIKNGKNFLIRSAASLPKLLGAVSDGNYLTRSDIVTDDHNGGLIIIGSHVNLTNQQFLKLRDLKISLKFIEFDVREYGKSRFFKSEITKTLSKVLSNLKIGNSVVIYTSRELLLPLEKDKERVLLVSVEISKALTEIVRQLDVRPKYMMAKGGITSSDIAVKGLNIKKAKVLGQIRAGIPVWLAGDESKFPQMPYLIFPGNVGNEFTLEEIVRELEGEG